MSANATENAPHNLPEYALSDALAKGTIEYWLNPASAFIGKEMTPVISPWIGIGAGVIQVIEQTAPVSDSGSDSGSGLGSGSGSCSGSDPATPCYSFAGTLTPALIDTQVNGGGGVLFNQQPTVAALATITDTHGRFGSGALLPTVISDDIGPMADALQAVIDARHQGNGMLVGIHFEGPHLGSDKRGCHSEVKLRALGEDEFNLYLKAKDELGCCLVTLAPERVDAADIRRLTEAGILVSLGHSNASFAKASAAITAGASGFTHLFNGMSGIAGREPGMVGAALLHDTVYAGIIFDGEHLHPASAQLAFRQLGRRLMLVTDAMGPAGTEDTEFDFFGGKVRRHGMALKDEAGSLAGSVLTMTGALRYAVQTLGIGVADALAMASSSPTAFLGLSDRGHISVGARADLLALDSGLHQLHRWQGGRLVAGAEPGADVAQGI